jgi:uncharacterized protein (TIGR00251 family)
MKRIFVHTVANARKNDIKVLADNIYKVKITAPPVDGLANQALIKLLAKHLRLHKSQLTILKGLTSDKKIIEINDL